MRPVEWVGSSYDDFRAFPAEVQDDMGYALYQAQIGMMHRSARPLKGFRGAKVVEIRQPFRGDTYRTVYTVELQRAIYVLHAFQKKAKSGVETPRQELELVRLRLRRAKEDDAEQGKAF